jgi:hypothetical protein
VEKVVEGKGQGEERSRTETTASWKEATPCTSGTGARSVATSEVLEMRLFVRKERSVSSARPRMMSVMAMEMTPPRVVCLRMSGLPTWVKWARENVSKDLTAVRTWRKKTVERDVAIDATRAAMRKASRMVEEASRVRVLDGELVSGRVINDDAGVVDVGRGAERAPGHRAPSLHSEHPFVV